MQAGSPLWHHFCTFALCHPANDQTWRTDMTQNPSDRVERNTSEEINRQISEETARNIGRFAHARPFEIEQRIAELNEEWDVERCLETMASSLSLLGLGLGVSVNRKWLMLPVVVQSFFLLHALQGWCPPLPMLRRFGVRTKDEIDREKYALKALRGDFRQIAEDPTHSNRMAAASAAVGL
jgi:hypothetical protein